MQAFVRIADRINSAVVQLVGLCMLIMAILVSIQVFARYVIGFSYPWTEELARYFMILAAFLGVGVAVRRGQMIAMEAVVQFSPPQVSRWLRTVAQVLTIGFFVILFKLGLDMLRISGEETAPVTKIPLFLVYGVLPVSCVIMLMNSVVVLIERHLAAKEAS